MNKPADAPSGEPLALRCNDVLAVVEKATKTCKKCATTLPLDCFYKDKGKYFQPYCKACRKKWGDEYRQTEKSKSNRKKYNQTTGNKLAADWRIKNPDRWKEIWKANAKRHADELSDYYLKQVLSNQLGIPFKLIPTDLVEMKREQLTALRLAREIRKAKNESSKDTDRVPGKHGERDHAGRPAADRGEQPAGAGQEGNQRHGRGGDGQRAGLDQQQPERRDQGGQNGR